MKRWPLLILIGMLGVQPGGSQTTVQEARDAGKALANAKRGDPTLVPTDERQAQAVPGYAGTTLPQSAYFDDPDRLVAEAAAVAAHHDGFQIATDPDRQRPRFAAGEIRATTARAAAVAADPATYLAGEAMTATSGSCVPLPPGTGTAGFYEASCNSGTKVEELTAQCRVPLVLEVQAQSRWRYLCQTGRGRRSGVRASLCEPFEPYILNGACRETSRQVVGQDCLQGRWPNCTEPGDPIEEATLSCIAQVPGQTGVLVQESVVTAERRDDGQCAAATAGLTCELQDEICLDADPATRIVNGLPVTRSCWSWRRRYSCHRLTPANDCAALEQNNQCTFLRTDCLDDPRVGACRVSEQVYTCPVPGGPAGAARQYICGGDVYCLNGDCEPITREASTEFKDALVGLHALGQAGKELDQSTFRVFSGSRDTCHKPVFGLVNCCAGKTSGVLTAAAGGAALAGGPAAIAALATPFLSMFLCGQDEMRLDIKDRMGFCHKVGTYCSASVLGICTTKRTAYCCFESKLSRILQEQGRPQIGKAWDTPKKETCKGFTVDEFARLDLSQMDFTEVYAEFIDAARLPDEIQTMIDIQAKIADYYALHAPAR